METTEKSKQEKKQPGSKNEIVINRVFDLPVNKMWQAWTEPEYFKKWWGPKGYTCPFSRMEAKEGGKYHSCMEDSNGKEYWATGVVKEFVPEKKLVVTDSFSDEKGNIRNASDYGMPGKWPDELLISVTMEEADGATKLRLQHEGIPGIMREICIQGWNESFDKLENNIK